MRRIILGLVLIALFVFAILAKTVDSLVAAQSYREPIGTATIHFEGRVTQVLEGRGLLAVTGVATLRDSTAPLASTTWQASAVLPFSGSNGTFEIPRQGQLRIRLMRAGVIRYTLVANLADITAILNHVNGVISVIVDGDVDVYESDSTIDDYENTQIASLETEFQLTNPWGPTEFQATIDQMDTQFPRTNTPSGPNTPGPTTPPIIEGPNS